MVYDGTSFISLCLSGTAGLVKGGTDCLSKQSHAHFDIHASFSFSMARRCIPRHATHNDICSGVTVGFREMRDMTTLFAQVMTSFYIDNTYIYLGQVEDVGADSFLTRFLNIICL